MGGVVIVSIIKIRFLLITLDMIQMGNLFIPIRISIKEQGRCQNLYKWVNQVHLLKLPGICLVVIYPMETPNMPGRMGRKLVHCFRCRQFGHYFNECPNQSFTEDYAPICENCKQSGHITDQCNAPFNFINRNQQM